MPIVICEADGLKITFNRKPIVTTDSNHRHTLTVEGPLLDKTHTYQVSNGDGDDVLLTPLFCTTPFQMALVGPLLLRFQPLIKRTVAEYDHPSGVVVPPALLATIQVGTTKRAVGLAYLLYKERYPGQENNASLFGNFANKYLSAEIIVHRANGSPALPDRVECLTVRAKRFVEQFLSDRPHMTYEQVGTGCRVGSETADAILLEARRCEIITRETEPFGGE